MQKIMQSSIDVKPKNLKILNNNSELVKVPAELMLIPKVLFAKDQNNNLNLREIDKILEVFLSLWDQMGLLGCKDLNQTD